MENPLKAFLKKPNIQVLLSAPHKGWQEKKRIKGFSLEGCFENFLMATDFSKVDVTLFLNDASPEFLFEQNHFPIIDNHPEEEANGFLALLDYVVQQKFSKEAILYFLDLTTIHKKGWVDLLTEGFTLKEVDYVSLCDPEGLYKGEEPTLAHLFVTSTSHWREIPFTDGAYGTKMKTLYKHLDIHREFSFQKSETDRAGKFQKLKRVGSHIISSIPGGASSTLALCASPCFPWEESLNGARV